MDLTICTNETRIEKIRSASSSYRRNIGHYMPILSVFPSVFRVHPAYISALNLWIIRKDSYQTVMELLASAHPGVFPPLSLQ